MPGKNKSFSCGHRGKGKFCHRCKIEKNQKADSRRKRTEWEETLSRAPMTLKNLPKNIAEKAIQIIQQMKDGKTYMEFKGKRMIAMGQRYIITIPIARKYRLICSDKEYGINYIEVITHETYNNRISSGGWQNLQK